MRREACVHCWRNKGARTSRARMDTGPWHSALVRRSHYQPARRVLEEVKAQASCSEVAFEGSRLRTLSIRRLQSRLANCVSDASTAKIYDLRARSMHVPNRYARAMKHSRWHPYSPPIWQIISWRRFVLFLQCRSGFESDSDGDVSPALYLRNAPSLRDTLLEVRQDVQGERKYQLARSSLIRLRQREFKLICVTLSQP